MLGIRVDGPSPAFRADRRPALHARRRSTIPRVGTPIAAAGSRCATWIDRGDLAATSAPTYQDHQILAAPA
jgi:hypothetical protein